MEKIVWKSEHGVGFSKPQLDKSTNMPGSIYSQAQSTAPPTAAYVERALLRKARLQNVECRFGRDNLLTKWQP
jgi:hypothetical protein